MKQQLYRHHNEQRLIARNVVAELDPIWRILDFHDLRGTTAPWLKAARPIIERGYLTSQYVAAEFVRNYRAAALPVAEPLDVQLPNPLGPLGIHNPAPKDVGLKIMVSMKVTGPLWVAQHTVPDMSESQITQVMSDGFSKSTGAATRLVLNGGRGMVRSLVGVDPAAKGVQSFTGESNCKACKQLAAGPLLKSKHTSKQMDAVAVGHDFCQCSAFPVY